MRNSIDKVTICSVHLRYGQCKRYAILQAAKQVVARDRVAHLTMEAVAREAGMSKGGALYHFSGKEALLRTLHDMTEIPSLEKEHAH